MTLDEFWEHIRATRHEDPDDHAEHLTQQLVKLGAENIVDFACWWNLMMAEAYHRNLWAAAFYANGGCSDDGAAGVPRFGGQRGVRQVSLA